MPEGDAPKGATSRKNPFFMKQAIMMRVVYALTPVAIFGIYFFGWRVAALVAVCMAAGILTERITTKQRGRPVSMAVFVTSLLYALSLPPTMPYWMAVVGIVVGVLFGKEVFGGFGRNFANPAIVGRAFVYVAFPVPMTKSFVPAFRGFPGGFAEWSWTAMDRVPEYLAGVVAEPVDALTSASPMWALRDYGYLADTWDIALGTMGGTFETATSYGEKVLAAGSIGEGCAPLLLAAGVYLMVTKTSNWRLTVSAFLGAALGWLLIEGVGGVQQPLYFKLLAGAFVYVSIFMITDPVSAPRNKRAMWLYGGVIGALIIILSWKSSFIAAASFSILLGNIFSPLMDRGAKAFDTWWAARKEPGEPAAEGDGR